MLYCEIYIHTVYRNIPELRLERIISYIFRPRRHLNLCAPNVCLLTFDGLFFVCKSDISGTEAYIWSFYDHDTYSKMDSKAEVLTNIKSWSRPVT